MSRTSANLAEGPDRRSPRGSRRRRPMRRVGAALSAWAVLLAAFGAPAATAGAAKKTAARCDASAGWTAAQGRPATLGRLGLSGFYVWNDKGTWRVSVTHENRKLSKFQGTLTFDAAVSGKPVGAEGTYGDVVVTGPNTVSFSFSNYGGVDGVAIAAPCATSVALTGTIDAVPVEPDEIFVGSQSLNPSAVPLTLTRTASATGATPGPSNVVTPVAAVTAPTSVPAPAGAAAVVPVAAEACDGDPWPSGVVGRPKILRNLKTAAPGIYVWGEKDRQTIRLVGVAQRSAPQTFTGRITASGPLTAVPIGTKIRRDSVKAEGNTVTFSFRTAGGTDGIEISAPCVSQVVIEALANDGLVTVFLGESATPIPALPYLVAR
jgi:hypothetical protein